eukprot:scaffold35436_cov66-Phaeocystis_antarctica.AAC.7
MQSRRLIFSGCLLIVAIMLLQALFGLTSSHVPLHLRPEVKRQADSDPVRRVAAELRTENSRLRLDNERALPSTGMESRPTWAKHKSHHQPRSHHRPRRRIAAAGVRAAARALRWRRAQPRARRTSTARWRPMSSAVSCSATWTQPCARRACNALLHPLRALSLSAHTHTHSLSLSLSLPLSLS